MLSEWRPILAYLPVETVIRDRLDAYYAALAASDQMSEATPFVEFMLEAIRTALNEAAMVIEPLATAQVTAQVKRMLVVLGNQVALGQLS